MKRLSLIILVGICLPRVSLENSPQPLAVVANQFARDYNSWTKLEAHRDQGTVDVETLRAWKQVEKDFKQLKLLVENEY